MANFAGWIMWYLYLDPTAYNAVFVAIYLYAIMILTSRDPADVGDNSEYRDGVIFLSDVSSSVKRVFQHKG